MSSSTPSTTTLICPTLQACGYQVERADTLVDQENILRTIVAAIERARLVVADLTGLNPNVMYELGIAHGLRRPVVLLTQSVESLPFDLRSYRVVRYSPLIGGGAALEADLRQIGEKHLRGELRFGSPVTDFGEAPAVAGPGAAAEQGLETDREQEERGFLDFIAEGSQASEEAVAILGRITEAMHDIAEKSRMHTQRIAELQSQGVVTRPRELLSAVSDAARDINAFARGVDRELPGLQQYVVAFAENTQGLASWVRPRASEHEQALRGVRASVAGYLTAVRRNLLSLQNLRGMAEDLRQVQIARTFSTATKRMREALDRMIAIMKMAEAGAARALSLIDDALDGEGEDIGPTG